jgi:hypothetical protein
MILSDLLPCSNLIQLVFFKEQQGAYYSFLLKPAKNISLYNKEKKRNKKERKETETQDYTGSSQARICSFTLSALAKLGFALSHYLLLCECTNASHP